MNHGSAPDKAQVDGALTEIRSGNVVQVGKCVLPGRSRYGCSRWIALHGLCTLRCARYTAGDIGWQRPLQFVHHAFGDPTGHVGELFIGQDGFVMLVQQRDDGLTAGDVIPLLPGLNLLPCVPASGFVRIEAGRDTPFAKRSALFSPQVRP